MPVPDRKAFAARCGAAFSTLNQAAHGRTLSEGLAIAIERESARAVTVEELRPDVPWHVIRNTTAKAAAHTEAA